ncbi:putative methyltransferase NSUN7 isoform X2 [Denticeps clupeoides]|uniref:putative methyltransferase NSUN7 isoform X2 n=1 Tax=Denticeps clupeoides TaxID=299321 RepID=UPI0010A506B4|nr:putative methyltransferase NSUN7 isoform X2 [Denticeps clupeoides]
MNLNSLQFLQPDDLMPLVIVMLFDLMDRKFQPTKQIVCDEVEVEPMEEVLQVQLCLCRFRTKLAASLARCRIKHNLLTIADTLPECVRRKQERAQTLPIYAWVNTLKSSVQNVCEVLWSEGFSEVDAHTLLEGKTFCRDTHCPDVLIFPSHTKRLLVDTHLVQDYTLNIQDKSRSLAACALRPLLLQDCDVMMVGSFSALTVAHVAVLAVGSSARVTLCGVAPDHEHTVALQRQLADMGCKNVQLIPENFVQLNEWDSRMQKVRLVLLMPRCSCSALNNPVDHIVNEDGDTSLLRGLSQGSVSADKLDSLTSKQRRDLSHALSFPRVHSVVYCTCSENTEENEQLVERALKSTENRPRLVPFRLIPLKLEGCCSETVFKLEANDFSNGCFLCVLAREVDPSKAETVQDVLARAVAKGLLDGILGPQPTLKEKRRSIKKTRLILPPLESPALPLPPALPFPTALPALTPSSETWSEESRVTILTSVPEPQTVTKKRKKKRRPKPPSSQHLPKTRPKKRRLKQATQQAKCKHPPKSRTEQDTVASTQEARKSVEEELAPRNNLTTSKQEVRPQQDATKSEHLVLPPISLSPLRISSSLARLLSYSSSQFSSTSHSDSDE